MSGPMESQKKQDRQKPGADATLEVQAQSSGFDSGPASPADRSLPRSSVRTVLEAIVRDYDNSGGRLPVAPSFISEARSALRRERKAVGAAMKSERPEDDDDCIDEVDDALQLAIAFLNDPEGLVFARDEWRERIRTALLNRRARLAAEKERS